MDVGQEAILFAWTQHLSFVLHDFVKFRYRVRRLAIANPGPVTFHRIVNIRQGVNTRIRPRGATRGP